MIIHIFHVALAYGTAIFHSASLYFNPIIVLYEPGTLGHLGINMGINAFCYIVLGCGVLQSMRKICTQKYSLPQIFQYSPMNVGDCCYFLYSYMQRPMNSFGRVCIENS